MSEEIVSPIGGRNVTVILLLSIAGQIAWAVENSWFNTFIYDRITKDPAPIAWMVGVSAATATITTIIMGILSDRNKSRFGRRKVFIITGYFFWGIMTAVYPMIEWIQTIGIAIVMAVVLDAVMTFFGSTANDAAFNAWLTDIGHSSNRNRIRMLADVSLLIAQIIAIGLAGIIIDEFGYFVFFYALGGYVSLTAIISSFLMKADNENYEKTLNTVGEELKSILDLNLLKENKTLFLLFSNIAIAGIAMQIYFPYIFIYMEHYIGMGKDEIGIYSAILLLSMIIALVIIGWISHRFNRRTLIIFGNILASLFIVMMGLFGETVRGNQGLFALIFLFYFLSQVPGMAAGIAHGGWMQDKYPQEAIGKFQGIRMIFFVAIPMMIGPFIGSFAIKKYGIPDGDGYIPTPELFTLSGILSLLALIPIFMIPKEEGQIHFIHSK